MSESMPIALPKGAAITLSVVSHGHGKMIDVLLQDLDQVEALRGARIIVTFNVPEQNPPTLECRGLIVECIHNDRPKGFASNHNAAFARCHTDLFLVLNPDVRLRDAGFEALLRPFSASPETALVVPVVESSSGQREDSIRANLSPVAVTVRRMTRPERRHLAGIRAARGGGFFWAAGMFMLFRAKSYAAIGGFDPRFHLYCEDYDICARLWLSGWTITIVEEYAIVHDAQRATRRSWRHLRWHIGSLMRTWSSRAFLSVCLGRLSGRDRNRMEARRESN